MTFYIAGTGTRKVQIASPEVKARLYSDIYGFLLFQMEQHGDVTVISGMAEGFDKALAAVALNLGLPLVCCVPNKGYGSYYWGQKSLTGSDLYPEFQAMLAKASEVEYTNEVYGTQDVYMDGIHMNFWRNQRMVERCDLLLAYARDGDRVEGGTSDCIKRARYKQSQDLTFEIAFLPPEVF